MGSLLISMTSLFTESTKYYLHTAEQAINPIKQLMVTDPRATMHLQGYLANWSLLWFIGFTRLSNTIGCFLLLPDCTVFSGTLKLFFTEEAFRSRFDLDPVSSMFKVHVVLSNRDLSLTSGKK